MRSIPPTAIAPAILLLLSALVGSPRSWAGESAADERAAQGVVVQVLRDFENETVGRREPIRHHTWAQEVAQNADPYSQVEVVDDPLSPHTRQAEKRTGSGGL